MGVLLDLLSNGVLAIFELFFRLLDQFDHVLNFWLEFGFLALFFLVELGLERDFLRLEGGNVSVEGSTDFVDLVEVFLHRVQLLIQRLQSVLVFVLLGLRLLKLEVFRL